MHSEILPHLPLRPASKSAYPSLRTALCLLPSEVRAPPLAGGLCVGCFGLSAADGRDSWMLTSCATPSQHLWWRVASQGVAYAGLVLSGAARSAQLRGVARWSEREPVVPPALEEVLEDEPA